MKLFLFALCALPVFGQSNAIELCDQQTPRHCITIKAPATLGANVVCTLGATNFGSCAGDMILAANQTVTGVKNWAANQTFDADNTYSIGTRASEAYAIYGRAIESQKFQFSDPLTPGTFWTTSVAISGLGTSTFTVNDSTATPALNIFRSNTGSYTQVLGNLFPMVSTSASLGSSSLLWKDIYFDNSTALSPIPVIRLGVNTVLNSAGYGNLYGGATIGGTLTLAAPGTIGCLQSSATGVVSVLSTPCGGGSGTVTSIATTGPISGGTITTSGTVSCPTCLTTTGVQTVTGVKNWAANQTFDADNTYSIGTRASEAYAIYGRAIESQKFQFSDPLTPGTFWTTSVAISGLGTSTFTVNDSTATPALNIFRSNTGSYTQVLGNLFPMVSTSASLGSSSLLWKDIYFDNSTALSPIPVIRLGVNTVLNSAGYGNLYGGATIGGTLTLAAPGTIGCLQSSATGVVSVLSTPCGGGSGTVTSIATTGPISGGTITTSGTISCPTCLTTTGGQTITSLDAFPGGLSVGNSATNPGLTTWGTTWLNYGLSGWSIMDTTEWQPQSMDFYSIGDATHRFVNGYIKTGYFDTVTVQTGSDVTGISGVGGVGTINGDLRTTNGNIVTTTGTVGGKSLQILTTSTFYGHLISSPVTAPTVAGTGCSLGSGSSDTKGIITLQSNQVCTLTFAAAYATAPTCLVTGYSGLVAWNPPIATSVLMLSAFSQQASYLCVQ